MYVVPKRVTTVRLFDFWTSNISTFKFGISQTRVASTDSKACSHHNIELNQLDQKWIERWKSLTNGQGLNIRKYKIDPNAEKFYALVMFPYPSGMLHMGHVRVYTISDVISRFKRLQGFNVIHPMGWDAFGLPAENAAIERGINPSIWTESNIAKMKEQMNLVLADFDWERELTTCKSDYYKWTQKIFLLLHEKGLAYKKEAEINWDPVDETVLANEQVDAQGKSWRSGALVEKRKLNQWFIGITEYAERLNKDLEILKYWPEKVKSMQRHWIGESHGVEIKLQTNYSPCSTITVFTSRPETIFSIQYLAISLNHPLVSKASETDKELGKFVECSKNVDKESKDGYLLDFIKASRPIDPTDNVLQEYELPIYVAPYVLDTYGTGAVMGCPAHDQRDFEFWKKHNPNIEPAVSLGPSKLSRLTNVEAPYVKSQGIMHDQSTIANGVNDLSKYRGMPIEVASKEITKVLENLNIGSRKVNYRLKDWLISRQRYWGAPIPMVYCDDCGTVPVPESELPVMLPDIDGKKFGRGILLSKVDSFTNTKCPSCGGKATRDSDTMDTFMDSSWYFFRYLDPHNAEMPFNKNKIDKDLPVDMYIGGIEHAILHLLYTRFISKFLGDIGLWGGEKYNNEPITQLVTQGMVQGLTFTDPETGEFIKPDGIDKSNPKNPIIISNGKTALTSYEKMSKSKYNGVDPADTVKRYGADATRAHMLFQAPISDSLNWNEDQIVGVDRWLHRVLSLHDSIVNYSNDSKTPSETNTYHDVQIEGVKHKEIRLNDAEVNLINECNSFIESIDRSINVELSFNTIVSDLMKYTNTIIAAIKDKKQYNKDLLLDVYKKLLVLMSPVTPCVAEEAWELLLNRLGISWNSIMLENFPEVQKIQSNDINYNVFINGKARLLFKQDKSLIDKPENDMLDTIFKHEAVNKFATRDKIKKIIKKPGMISLVVSPK